jgi:hypothetical protein
VVGDVEWVECYSAARAEAHAQPTQQQRDEAFRAMQVRFGGERPTTSRTITPAAPMRREEEAYRAQEQRLNNPESVHKIQSLTVSPDEAPPVDRRNRTVFRRAGRTSLRGATSASASLSG